MRMSLPRSDAVRVDFPVRLVVRDEDVRKLRGERMNPHVEHIDTIVQLGAEDFANDDERLFAVDFAQTLASERGAHESGTRKLVPGRLVLDGIGYPIDAGQVAEKLVSFLKTGVAEGLRRATAKATLKAQIVAVRQMVRPVVARYVESKETLVRRCLDWGVRQKAAAEALDEGAFAKLKRERATLEKRLSGQGTGVLEELAKELATALATAAPDIEWTVKGLIDYGARGPTVQRSESGVLASSVSAALRASWDRTSPEIELTALVTSPMFRPWTMKDSISLDGIKRILDAFDVVQNDGSQEVFDEAEAQRAEKAEDDARTAWVAAHGSVELKAALAKNIPWINLYGRERFVAKCNAAGADLTDFLIDVDVNLFCHDTLRTHDDPSTRSLRLIAELAGEIPAIGVARVQGHEAQVKCEHNEVVCVVGQSIAPGCPSLYLWRRQPTSRGKR